MGNRTIPILVTCMVLALIGIIFIQYKWIEESLDEKKRLIDHKVHQMAANVDQRMSDLSTIAFVSSVPQLDSAFIEKITAPFNYKNYDTTVFGDSMMLSYAQQFSDTNAQSEFEVRIISEKHFSDSESFNEIHERQLIHDQGVDNFSFLSDSGQGFQMSAINSMVERIQVEVGDNWTEQRLDSAQFAKELMDESAALGLISPTNWGVFDHLDSSYSILPGEEEEWDFTLPLFKNDILHPDRYTLRLNMADNNAVIWKEVMLMISLSLLFIAIIIFVFIYSIRLVIKHKKISEIKSDFINNMTHEFKTPLASISLAADSILHPKVAPDPEKVKSYIDIIKVEKTKLNRHIETILEVASLKQDNIDIALSKVELSDTVNRAIDKLGLLISDRNSTLELKLDDTLSILANPYHLENVFSNLIENSIKYSEGNPHISITTERKGELSIIKIKDKGIGMTKEQVKRAFDHFYRAQKGNIHNTKGFGLGLSFVKYMVDKMKGNIRIESELTKGTTVIIEFELCQ